MTARLPSQVPVRPPCWPACWSIAISRCPATCLAEDVWRARLDTTAKRLRMAVARLRKVLAPVETRHRLKLQTIQGGYMLCVADGALDAEVFASRLRDAQHALHLGDAPRARSLVIQALGLWRGPALGDVSHHDFAQTETRRLEDLFLIAQETRFEAELGLGRHQEVVSELTSLVAKHPERERLVGQLMVSLYRCGRQAEALQAVQRVHAHLCEEFGLVPGPALKALQHQILGQDPALLPGSQQGLALAGHSSAA